MKREAGRKKEDRKESEGTKILQGDENGLRFPIISIQSILFPDITGEGTRRYKPPGIKY